MSNEKFTEGPWRVKHDGGIWATKGGMFVRIGTVDMAMIDGKANAAFIEAAPEMFNDENDKIVHLQTLKNQICCLLATKKDTVVTLDFVLKYIDEIIGDTENLLAKARGEGKA